MTGAKDIIEPTEELEHEEGHTAADIMADTHNRQSDSASTEEETDDADMISGNAQAARADFDEHNVEALGGE